jgi:hypothetical protein
MSSRIIQNGNPEEDVKLGDDIILSQIFAWKFSKTDASAWPADKEMPDDKRQGQCKLWRPPNTSESCPVTADQTIQVGIDMRVQRESCQKIFTEAACTQLAADSNKNEGRSSLYVANSGDILLEKCDFTENCKFENGTYYLTYPMGEKGHKLEIAINPPT